jgi:prepilin-type N-terminal cleavage/methylation domain-containing protein
MKKSLKGFTLVEMLIVISIIAILSGAILAGMGSSRTKARNARVTSDVNTLQLIVENSYAAGVYPADEAALEAIVGTDGSKATNILTPGGDHGAAKVHYCVSGSSYRVQGTLEAGKDADDLLKSGLKTAVGTCSCDGLNFCVGE